MLIYVANDKFKTTEGIGRPIFCHARVVQNNKLCFYIRKLTGYY